MERWEKLHSEVSEMSGQISVLLHRRSEFVGELQDCCPHNELLEYRFEPENRAPFEDDPPVYSTRVCLACGLHGNAYGRAHRILTREVVRQISLKELNHLLSLDFPYTRLEHELAAS